MPNTDSFPDQMLDLKKLQAAFEEHMELLGDVATEVQQFNDGILRLEELRARQNSFTAARQRATQELKEELGVVRELAMRLRAAAKLKLGPRSELLVHFGVAPLRRRTRRTTKEVPPPPPPVEAAAEAVKKPEAEAA
jgi:hypothetical protein